jgi:RimJ/RimL family protein N-acetyltransferase
MSEAVAVPMLETPRPRLRWWVEADGTELHAAFGDAATMRFWDCPPCGDVAETVAMIRASRTANPRFHTAFAGHYATPANRSEWSPTTTTCRGFAGSRSAGS